MSLVRVPEGDGWLSELDHHGLNKGFLDQISVSSSLVQSLLILPL